MLKFWFVLQPPRLYFFNSPEKERHEGAYDLAAGPAPSFLRFPCLVHLMFFPSYECGFLGRRQGYPANQLWSAPKGLCVSFVHYACVRCVDVRSVLLRRWWCSKRTMLVSETNGSVPSRTAYDIFSKHLLPRRLSLSFSCRLALRLRLSPTPHLAYVFPSILFSCGRCNNDSLL